VTVRMDPAVKRAIAGIPDTAWETIEYTDAVFDETTGTWVSRAEVAETGFTAFTSRRKTVKVTGRPVVRHIPELNPKANDGRNPCSTPTGTTRSSPPWIPKSWTRSQRTGSTATRHD
jgi:hypothetical protein